MKKQYKITTIGTPNIEKNVHGGKKIVLQHSTVFDDGTLPQERRSKKRKHSRLFRKCKRHKLGVK